jgi:hypothetical protein
MVLDDGTPLEAHALVAYPVGTNVGARVESRHIVILGE